MRALANVAVFVATALLLACAGKDVRVGGKDIAPVPGTLYTTLLGREKTTSYSVLFEVGDRDWEVRRTRTAGLVRWDDAYFGAADTLSGSSAVEAVGTCGWSSSRPFESFEVSCRAAESMWIDVYDPIFRFSDDFATSVTGVQLRTIAGVSASCFALAAQAISEVCLTTEGIPVRLIARNPAGGAEFRAIAVAVDSQPDEGKAKRPLIGDGFAARFLPTHYTKAQVALPALPRLSEVLREP